MLLVEDNFGELFGVCFVGLIPMTGGFSAPSTDRIAFT
jgi:hypothetical protein